MPISSGSSRLTIRISIFFCPESKYTYATELEKDRSFALIDKVKANDLKKLLKQKLYIPASIVDMIFMTQNLQTVISLCFGDSSISASFLLGWTNHMYENRLMYSSLQASNPSFFAKVLLSINNALQIYWRSCCHAKDRASVNDKVLLQQDAQDIILHHNFVQQLPKSIKDKIVKPVDDKNIPGKFPGQRYGIQKDKDKNHQKELLVDNDKSPLCWRVMDGKNYSQLFYQNQKKCPKNKDCQPICIKLFLRGFCDKNCNQAHKMSKEEESEFDSFVACCREGGNSKPDF
jgi:hypothetical protein